MTSPRPFHNSFELDKWIKENCLLCQHIYDEDAERYCELYEPLRKAFGIDGTGYLSVKDAQAIGYTGDGHHNGCPKLERGV